MSYLMIGLALTHIIFFTIKGRKKRMNLLFILLTNIYKKLLSTMAFSLIIKKHQTL
jgi:hypothetical protein